MTKFKNGAFELAVTRPDVMGKPRVKVHAPKGCKVSFDGPPGPDVPVVHSTRRLVNLSREEREKKDAANLVRSVRRARQRIRGLLKTLEADHMLTFSYRENMDDIERLKADWERFLRMMRGRFPEWKCVCVREQQDRGAYHLHVGVHGKQPIKWILRCWLLAIGQDWDEVQQWYIHGAKLGDKSLGAVNVRAPMRRRWGTQETVWRTDRLAGYMTKYLGKEFAKAEHHSLRYWHSKGIEKPVVVRWWLGSVTFAGAVTEVAELVRGEGARNVTFWQPDNWENLYVCGDGGRVSLERSAARDGAIVRE